MKSLACRCEGRCALDFRNLFLGKFQVAGAHDAFGLLGIARSDDGAGDRRMAKSPGDGDFTGRAAVARSNLPKTLDKREILGKARLAKFRIAAAEIISRQRRRALASHGAGE